MNLCRRCGYVSGKKSVFADALCFTCWMRARDWAMAVGLPQGEDIPLPTLDAWLEAGTPPAPRPAHGPEAGK